MGKRTKSLATKLIWQTMEKAPKDGTRILLFQREFGPDVFYWMGNDWTGTDWENSPPLDPTKEDL